MTADPVVYVTTDPEIAAAVRQQKADQEAWLTSVQAAIITLSWSNGRADIRGTFGPLRVVAVGARDHSRARADGWKSAGRRAPDDLVVPIKGSLGQAARTFLADIGTCRQLAGVVGTHGAPEYVSQGTGDGRELISAVRAYVLGDAVHIEYPVEPTDRNVSRFASDHRGAPDARWTREPLSAFHAAKEAEQVAIAAGGPR